MGYFRQNIEDMIGYEPGAQPENLDVIKLNTNENPYPPSNTVLQAIKNIDPENLRRYPNPFGNDFRTAAAKLWNLKKENIICSNGGDDLLTIAIRAFCDSDKPLVYPTPTYSLYPVLAKIQNCDTIEIPFDKEFNLPAKLASTDAGLIILCNPNAPSGTAIPTEEITELALETKSVLLIDEAYADFAEDNCVKLVKDFDNIIILRSMSKGYSLAGIRFGYGIANENLITGLMKVKDSYNVDTAAITAATAAIGDTQYFAQNIEKIKIQRTKVTAELKKIGFEVYPSQTNFVLAKNTSTKINAMEIYEKLKEKNILVRYWAQPELKDKFRITIGTAQQNDKLINALKEILSILRN